MIAIIAIACAVVLVAAVAYVIAAAIFRRPQRGLLLLAAFVPLNGLLFLLPLPGFVSGWKEGLVLFTLGCAWIRRTRSPTSPPVLMPWWPAAALFVVFGSVSALATFGVVGIFAIKVTYFYILLVVIMWLAPLDAQDRDNVVSILMGMGAFTSFVGILQLTAGPAALVSLGYEYGTQVRTSGGLLRTFSTFNLPFPFGLYVMLSLLVGGAVALADPQRRRNMLFLVTSPVMVVAMASSIVRGAILGLVVGVIYLIAIRFRFLAAPLGIAAASIAVIVPFVPKITAVFFSSSSLGQRGDGWNNIIASILVHPLGTGLGSSGSAADRISTASGTAFQKDGLSTNYQPDNYFVKATLELGPIGLWAVVALLIATMMWCTRLSRSLPGNDGALALGVGASIVAAMFASLVSTYFEIFPIDVYFWLLLGVVGCAAAQHGSSTGRSRSGQGVAVYRPISASY
ncbi:O-antigen ligase family protein [Rhodococcus sp. G-MC3]|uniref:O-antigen ligase family protein n=1 Tax=Rhodococcus sp. G-MC3 TaxID=3046209 RepID=UPI0024BBDFF8|nr:O-antigen ligase family protein [Rhodococcus sp. G-MC3]MDJ0395791.1 O-antigen ligase family protein [Rhodococcus sp. G-MC3]